jgi:hypothetical protein
MFSNPKVAKVAISGKKVDFQKFFWVFKNGQKKMSKIENLKYFLEKISKNQDVTKMLSLPKK